MNWGTISFRKFGVRESWTIVSMYRECLLVGGSQCGKGGKNNAWVRACVGIQNCCFPKSIIMENNLCLYFCLYFKEPRGITFCRYHPTVLPLQFNLPPPHLPFSFLPPLSFPLPFFPGCSFLSGHLVQPCNSLSLHRGIPTKRLVRGRDKQGTTVGQHVSNGQRMRSTVFVRDQSISLGQMHRRLP